MNKKNLTKQIALASGLLAFALAPAMTRAQSNSQSSGQSQTQSQATPAPAQKEAKKQSAMAGLNLTDDQKAQMKTIREQTKTQLEAVRKDESLSADQQREKVHQLRHDARMQMVKLMTPEQRQQYKANVRALRAARHEKQQAPAVQKQG